MKVQKNSWNKIKYLIELENNDSNDCGDKYIKTRYDSSDSLPLKQELEMHNVVIFVSF